MNPEWSQLDKLLHGALALTPDERDGFLRQTCGGDKELEREARSLLSLEPRARAFLETPAFDVAGAWWRRSKTRPVRRSESRPPAGRSFYPPSS